MKIWEPDANKIEPVLKLQHDSDGSIYVIAVNEDGCKIQDGILLTIIPNEFLYIDKGVNPSLDFKFDNYGRIKVNEEYNRAPVERAGLHREPIFRLVEWMDTIYLSLIDEDGYQLERGNIVAFCSREIIILENVNPHYGLPLDKNGKIVTR